MSCPIAYIDPGTGSLIIQALVAVLMSIVLVFRGVRQGLVRGFSWVVETVFRRKHAEVEAETPGPGEGSGPIDEEAASS
jgi:hypothetical protein